MKNQSLIDLRDEARGASKSAHDRMKFEQMVYESNDSYPSGSKIGKVNSIAMSSIDPKIRKAVVRLNNAFEEQMARIQVQPDRTDHTLEHIELCEDIQNWVEMNDDASGEGEELRTAILHHNVYGQAITKACWDHGDSVARMKSIHPMNFHVDPACSMQDLSDAEHCWHSEFQTARYIKRDYPDFDIPLKPKREGVFGREQEEVYRVDEGWIRKERALEAGVKCKDATHDIVLAVIIDDKIVGAWESPYWWPDMPFVGWRNFTGLCDKGQLSHNFYGYGYGTFMWPQQKLLDELLANLVLIVRNLSVGRFVTRRGALEMSRVLAEHGLNIELEEGYDVQRDIEHLPPDAVPEALFKFTMYVVELMEDMAPSLNPVFTGNEPSPGSSGRAINSLQYAAHSQISSNVRQNNEFRLLRERMKVTMLQQFAKQVLRPHKWRGGLDLPERFPHDARWIGYQLAMPDTTAMPNTPAGKLQVVQMLASMGHYLTPDKLIQLLGLDKGYGIKAEDFVAMGLQPGMTTGGGAPQVDEQAVSGLEASMSAER